MQQASLYARTQAAAQAVEGAREVVFCHPPSSPFVLLAAFDADQLSVLGPFSLASFTDYQVRLGPELTRKTSPESIF